MKGEQPVIGITREQLLEGGSRDTWLDPEAEAGALQELLGPIAAERVDFFPVSRIVNSPSHDVPACIEPV